jgi:hypothetical protein
MIIKVDNRETTLIPLIEHRVEVFMNSNTDDLHEGVDDGIGDDGKVSSKKPKSRKSVISNANAANNGCLVPLHIFSDLEMNVEMTACYWRYYFG